MELHVEAQHTEMAPTLQDWIRTRCQTLNTPYEAIFYVRVALVKHPRHLHGSDEARGFLTLSGKTMASWRRRRMVSSLTSQHTACRACSRSITHDVSSNPQRTDQEGEQCKCTRRSCHDGEERCTNPSGCVMRTPLGFAAWMTRRSAWKSTRASSRSPAPW